MARGFSIGLIAAKTGVINAYVKVRDLDRPARSCEDVNRELRARDRAEILIRGRGYYYFAEGFAHHWRSSTVNVYRIGDLTIRQWLERHQEFVDANRDREEAEVLATRA